MRFLKSLPNRSRFANNIWLVARANLFAQALPIIAAPLLTRLYSPADFGVLAIFMAILGLGLAAGTMRFEWSVPNARSQTMAAGLMLWGASVLLASTCVFALFWGVARSCLPSSWQALGAAGWLLPIALLGAGLQQLLQAWHVRSASLAPVGRFKVMQSIASVVASLLASGWGAWGLITGALVGAWIGLGVLWRHARSLPAALRRLNRRRMAAGCQRFRSEAAWSTLAAVMNTASFAVVPLMLARHYSAADVGYYALMQRVALGPVTVVTSAVSQSFWAEAARLVRTDPDSLARLYLRSTVRLAALAVALALLALAGPIYVGPVLGAAQWQQAGWVLAASAPMLVGQAVVSPLSHLIVHGKQHWQAIWDAARVGMLCLGIESIGRAGASLNTAVLAISLVMAAMYAALFIMNIHSLKIAQRKISHGH